MRLRLSALLLASLVLTGVTGCGPTSSSEPPPQLIGVWTTESPAYRDRFLQIERDSVRFGTGQEEAPTYRITAVLQEEEDTGVAFTIRFQEPEGDESRLHVDYDPTSRALRLKSRPQVIWTRQDGGSQPQEAAEPDGGT